MAVAVPIEVVNTQLEDLLKQMRPGETITLIGSEGTPLAVVVPLKAQPAAEAVPGREWKAAWQALAEEIGRAWKGSKSAVDVLAEMRR